MDPISIGLGIVGLGVSLFGGMKQAETAKQQAAVSGQIAGVEGQENSVRQQAMEVSASRAQLENLRTMQRARALSETRATNQNAQFGSGLQGGLAQVTDEGIYGAQGINQQLDFGRQIFGYDKQISGYKQQLASLGGQAATDQGITSLGGAFLKSGPMIGAMTKGLFGSTPGPIGTFDNSNFGAAPTWST